MKITANEIDTEIIRVMNNGELRPEDSELIGPVASSKKLAMFLNAGIMQILEGQSPMGVLSGIFAAGLSVGAKVERDHIEQEALKLVS